MQGLKGSHPQKWCFTLALDAQERAKVMNGGVGNESLCFSRHMTHTHHTTHNTVVYGVCITVTDRGIAELHRKARANQGDRCLDRVGISPEAGFAVVCVPRDLAWPVCSRLSRGFLSPSQARSCLPTPLPTCLSRGGAAVAWASLSTVQSSRSSCLRSCCCTCSASSPCRSW